MVLSETRGLWLYRVVRGGLGCRGDSVAEATQGLTTAKRLTLEPERQPNRRTSTGGEAFRRSASLPSDAQAACGFKCSALKRSPFFQRVKTLVANFRATITRAISAFFPVASWRA